MNVRDFKATVKDENVKDADEIVIRISVQQNDGTWVTEIVPVEAYYVKRDGKIQLGCCLWNPNCEDDE